MTDKDRKNWVQILKDAGEDVSFVESHLKEAQRKQEIRTEEERTRQLIVFPEDIRSVTGDKIELVAIFQGGGRKYMQSVTYEIRNNDTFSGGNLSIAALWHPKPESSGLLFDARDIRDLPNGKRYCPRKKVYLNTGEKHQLPLVDIAVCKRCSQRLEIGPLVDHCRGYTQDEFWDMLRPLVGHPFERLIDSDDAPEHNCDFHYGEQLEHRILQRRKIHREREQQRAEEARRALLDEESRREPKSQYVYLMKDFRNGFLKIGISNNTTQRERTLQSQVPETELLWQLEGQVADERHLHKRFESKRMRGEWFELTEEDVAWICASKSSDDLYRE